MPYEAPLCVLTVSACTAGGTHAWSVQRLLLYAAALAMAAGAKACGLVNCWFVVGTLLAVAAEQVSAWRLRRCL